MSPARCSGRWRYWWIVSTWRAAGAPTITVVAYLYARHHAHDESFTFGTGKIRELAGYSSAIILAVVALLIGIESVMRLIAPISIRFNEVIGVAVLGLIVNLLERVPAA